MAQADLEQRAESLLNSGLPGRWYVVAKSGDIAPGRVRALRILGKDLVVWRGADGGVRCIEDRCPHRGARLSLGDVVDSDVACRYHGVTLDGDGKIVRVPAIGNCGLEGRKVNESFAVTEAADGVFVWFPAPGCSEPAPLALPHELTSPDWASFLTTSPWNCNYRYVLDNLVDPMHGIYLHSDTFTLSRGMREDKVSIEPTPRGFIIERVAQQGVNVDWAEVAIETSFTWSRVLIPYPPAGGPGGAMFVIACVTPVDTSSCQIFFWRTREVSGAAREAWRFLFRAHLEVRHWYVLEQDRRMMASIVPDARSRELLYQNDMGVVRLRRILARKAREIVEREEALASRAAS
jgi:phenylpropionate dioxygenase-like ring-hydroxylating dioxygenase large terminal subunit